MPRKKTPDDSKPLSVEQARGKIAKAMRDLVAGHDPGPITFRLKRTKKADETYPLRLTQQQRESMIHATRIKNKVKERLQQSRGRHADRRLHLEGTGPPERRTRPSRPVRPRPGQEATRGRPPQSYRPAFRGTCGRLRGHRSHDPQDGPEEGRPDLPVQDHAAGHQAGDLAADSGARLHAGRPARVHPGGVRLVELPPAPVRHRRRAVRPTGPGRHGLRPGDDRRDGRSSQQADPEVGPEVPVDLRVRLRRRLAARGSCSRGSRPSTRRRSTRSASEGERACPPEDCGGPWGYADYLAAIADPQHERHEELLEWRGPFDPEAFDAKKATREMRKVK